MSLYLDRRAWTVGAIVLATSLVAPFAAIPVVRSIVGARARKLGLDVSIGRVLPVLGVVHLRDVTVRLHELPTATASLGYVDLHPVLARELFRIEAHSGKVTLSGPLSEIRRGIEALRPPLDRSARPREAGGRARPILVDGVDAVWTGAFGGTALQNAWGVRYERSALGAESVSVDLVRAGTRRHRVEIERGSASFDRRDGARKLTGASAEAVVATLAVSASSELGLHAPPPPPAPSGPGPSPWCARRADLSIAVSSFLAPGSEISVPNVRFEIRRGAQLLNVGPATVVVGLSEDGNAHVALTSAKTETGTPVKIAATLAPGGPAAVDFSGGPVPLAALGVKEGDMGLLDVSKSEVVLGGHARLDGACRAVSWDGSASVSALSLESPRLAAEAIRAVDLGLSGSGEASLDGERIALTALEVSLGRARLRASGALEREGGHTQGNLRIEVPPTACSDIAESVPPALAPLFAGMQVQGTAALTGVVAFDTRRLGDTRVTWEGENLCRFTAVPPSLSPERFREPWERTVLDASGLPTAIQSGPGTPGWVPYSEIPAFVTTAVLVCEDSRFFSHHGMDPKSLSDALRDDLRAGRFVRGGSTVTMQLAKNLFLGREKTLSRKLQEAALTLLLEQSFTKEEILELYLNVVELAPGVYGIGPAADYYFHTPAKHLSLAQAFYLVSLLPNPKQPHFAPDGTLRPVWAAYLRKLMTIGKKIGRIDDAALAAGLAEEIHLGFATRGAGEEAEENPPPEVTGP